MGREPLPDHYSYPVPFVHQANWGKNVQFQCAIPSSVNLPALAAILRLSLSGKTGLLGNLAPFLHVVLLSQDLFTDPLCPPGSVGLGRRLAGHTH